MKKKKNKNKTKKNKYEWRQYYKKMEKVSKELEEKYLYD